MNQVLIYFIIIIFVQDLKWAAVNIYIYIIHSSKVILKKGARFFQLIKFLRIVKIGETYISKSG